jgi:hypothetical protein
MPIAPKQLAGRRSRPDPGQKTIFFLSEHGSAPCRNVDELRRIK